MWVKEELVNVRERPGDGRSLEDVKDASSAELIAIDEVALPLTSTHDQFQHRATSWSHNGDWGVNAVKNANKYIQLLKSYKEGGLHYEDDVFCDFGGNDGTVAEAWRVATGNVAISVDLDGLKQGWGQRSYPEVNFINSVLEDIPLEDKSVDWGFCSHTLEHVADLSKALSEIRRIVRRGLFVVVPLENEICFRRAAPHMRGSNNIADWLAHLRHPSMRMVNWSKGFSWTNELYIIYAFDDFGMEVNDMNWYWLDNAKDSETSMKAAGLVMKKTVVS